MLGERDSFEFVLARDLGMTVAELNERMGAREYEEWKAFYTFERVMVELKAKRR